jgi:hypothetical protein
VSIKKASGRTIENDEQYLKSLSYLTETALKYDDPLDETPATQKEKDMKVYDHVSDLVQRYRRSQLVKEYPSIRAAYATLGWNYDEPIEAKPTDTPLPEPIKTEPPKAVYRDFLDDDD